MLASGRLRAQASITLHFFESPNFPATEVANRVLHPQVEFFTMIFVDNEYLREVAFVGPYKKKSDPKRYGLVSGYTVG
jgi:hypothetical protein